MRLLHIEETDGVKIMHCCNGRECRLPELTSYSLEGICPETRTVYELFGCYYQGHTCQTINDFTTLRGGTIAERYDQPMLRLEKETGAGYVVKVQSECEFDDAGRTELLAHPIVQQSALRYRDALYGARTEAMRLHYKAREMKLCNMSTS